MSFLKSWKNEILLLAVAALYAACCWLASLSIGQQDRFHGLMYIGNAALFTEVLFYLFIIVYGFYLFALLFIHKPAHPLAFLKTRVLAGPLNRERLLRALPVLIAFIVVFSVFTSMKFMIAAFQPYGWDETFLHLDRIIHFGHDPWRLLMPFLGYAPVTWAVNLIYNLWLPILFAVLYWQLFSLKHPQARMQFFLAFTLTWAINGTLLAILFSSVGPCFLERLDGNAYYLPMMDYLHTANGHYNIMALPTQDKLWETYKNKGFMLGGGISAMPSIHVSTALLYLLLARKKSLKCWPVFALFLLAIMAGSVHLGWHYASDGYIAILTTLAIWTGSGCVLRLTERGPDVPD